MPGGLQKSIVDRFTDSVDITTNANLGFENGNINDDWAGTKTGWAIATDEANAGTYSAKMDNTNPTKGTLIRAITVPATGGIFKFGFSSRADSSYDGRIKVVMKIHGGQITTDTRTPTADTWVAHNFTVTGASMIHAGEAALEVTINGDAFGSNLGNAWLDDFHAELIGFPLQVWIPERYRGYMFEGDSRTLKVVIDLFAGGFTDALGDLELFLELLDFDNQSTSFSSQTLDSLVGGRQTTTFDLSGIAMDTNLLLTNVLRRKSDGVTASYSQDSSTVTFPNYKLVLARNSVRDALPAYIDFNSKAMTWKHTGGGHRSRFVWGIYARFITAWTTGTYPSTVQTDYRDLKGLRYYATQDQPKAFPSMRQARINFFHAPQHMQGADIGSSVDEVSPAILEAMKEGIFYSQHTREFRWWGSDQERPDWFEAEFAITPNANMSNVGAAMASVAHGCGLTERDATLGIRNRSIVKRTSDSAQESVVAISDVDNLTLNNSIADLSNEAWTRRDEHVGWAFWVTKMSGKRGLAAMYSADEIFDTAERTTQPNEYHYWKENMQGTVFWGLNALTFQVLDHRLWHMLDVVCGDIYPVRNGSVFDQGHWGASDNNPGWTWSFCETLRIGPGASGDRSFWAILQLFARDTIRGMPAYSHMLHQCISALITGAKGIIWWELGVAGPQSYVAANQHDTFFDIAAGTGSKSYNIHSVGSAVSGRFVEGVNRISLVAPRSFILYFNQGNQVGHVSNWTPDSDGNLTIAVDDALLTSAKINVVTGEGTIAWDSVPSQVDLWASYTKTSDIVWRDLVDTSNKIMNLESVWLGTIDNTLFTSVTEGGSPAGIIKWAAWPHPHNPNEIVLCVANLIDTGTGTVTMTLASAAPGGAIIEVYARTTGPEDIANLSWDTGTTVFSDIIAASGAVIYIIREDSARVRTITDPPISKAGLEALGESPAA
ncbi:MAG TPA: hypothetical protein ENI05_01295 [Porticoccus sp.]|nr:hypothetical protein [Porticoccus sp.]